MFFQNLEDKQTYYRSLSDYRLLSNSHVLVMLDGRSFSKLIKNKYKKPFDSEFIDIMNSVAVYLCQNVMGAKFAYVQSDEISLYLCDFENIKSDSFFGYRLSKMQSIMASMAASKFNQLVLLNQINSYSKELTHNQIADLISTLKLAEFDCKCWNVPTDNDVFGWFLYRQIDCIRNSKQQAAQTYLSHNSLKGLDTDKQIEKLLDVKGIDWNNYADGEKYGRFIYKVQEDFHNDELNIDYTRNVWKAFDGFPLMEENNRTRFMKLLNFMNDEVQD